MRRTVTGGALATTAAALCVTALLSAAPASSPVADAAMQGDRDVVRTLLKQGGDVNAAQGDGMTALHWAAMKNDADLAQALLYAGANVKATTRIGAYTPLILAAKAGNAAVMVPLLAAGADVNTSTANGTTPLMFAAASGNTDAVKVLLDRGGNVNAKESVRGLTAMMFAAASNRAAVIQLLSTRGGDVKAATRVVDLAALSKDPTALQGIVFGNPAPPPKEGEKAQDQRLPGARGPGGRGEEGVAVEEANASAAKDARGAEAAKNPKEGAKDAKAADAKNAKASDAKPEGKLAANEATPPVARENVPGEKPAAKKPAPRKAQLPGVDRQFLLNELVAAQGGMTPLLLAAREGYQDAAQSLLAAGADVNQVSAGDHTSPLLMATINGHFDLARFLLEKGADPKLAAENGATPLYAALNCEWAPKALYPQPRAYLQQKTTYLDLMKALLEKGADPNVRLKKKVWYSGYSFDLSGVDEIGATPFWRAAYASDVDAMKLLVAHGADPNLPTSKPAGRPRTGDGERDAKDVSGLPPVPVGGPGVTPLQAAAGVGYGEGFAANAHRFAPTGMLAAVKYLVEELHADVNARDHEGNTALHHAASRGDNEMIQYLVSKGADVKVVNREGKTTVDMANGPVQRIQPFPDTIALLEKLGAKNNHKCVSC